MKCPKCGYLGFEDVDRCRNCGYEFALARSDSFAEFPLRDDSQTLNALGDLSIVESVPVPPADVRMTEAARPLTRMPSAELPLFAPDDADDEPLIKTRAAPRPPLAVRRSTPELPRVRPEQPRVQTLDLRADARVSERVEPERPTRQYSDALETAAIATRFVAAAVDLVLLAGIDLIVIYFTMQICGVTVAELNLLPKGPLLAFLLVQNGGYLVAFTAGGQTLGKMATGIRVVEADSTAAVDVGRATLRTVIWLILALPAGLGFLTLIGSDRRGLHDRFAQTRVVRSPL